MYKANYTLTTSLHAPTHPTHTHTHHTHTCQFFTNDGCVALKNGDDVSVIDPTSPDLPPREAVIPDNCLHCGPRALDGCGFDNDDVVVPAIPDAPRFDDVDVCSDCIWSFRSWGGCDNLELTTEASDAAAITISLLETSAKQREEEDEADDADDDDDEEDDGDDEEEENVNEDGEGDGGEDEAEAASAGAAGEGAPHKALTRKQKKTQYTGLLLNNVAHRQCRGCFPNREAMVLACDQTCVTCIANFKASNGCADVDAGKTELKYDPGCEACFPSINEAAAACANDDANLAEAVVATTNSTCR